MGYVERNAVFKVLTNYYNHKTEIQHKALLEAIDNIPDADAQEIRHGFWEEKIVDEAEMFFRRRFYCSVCNNWTSYGKTKFCPHCGAKMDSEARNG